MSGPLLRTLKLSGPFTDDDLAEFAAVMRRIDARNPGGVYVYTVLDPEGSTDEGTALIERMLPPLPDRATAFARSAYRNDSFPRRYCDYCDAIYRGPAVYCSLECAVADA